MDSLVVLNDLSLLKQKQQFDIAINKLKTIKSIVKSNKDDLEYRKIIITKHKIEWHRKISLAVACLLLFLVGSSMGAIVRKGGFGLPVLKYDRTSKGSVSYLALAGEILRRSDQAMAEKAAAETSAAR
mgnify:CR=1 FL=1